MKQLILTLFSEGSTNERFLPTVIQRTAQRLLPNLDVQIPIKLSPKNSHEERGLKRSKLILQAALDAYGSHALVIHSDADYPTAKRAYNERFKPGRDEVQKAKEQGGHSICEHLIPLIPVQMVEGWMLADAEALLNLIGTDLNAVALEVPTKIKEVESVADPKQVLEDLLRRAYAARTKRLRKKKTDIGWLYEPLGAGIRLETLEQVPSYQKFVECLTTTLIDLGFLR